MNRKKTNTIQSLQSDIPSYRAITRHGLLLAYSVLIYALSSNPVEMPGASFPGNDKWLHGIAYAVMAWLAWQALQHWPLSHPGRWAWLYAAGYGATDEWHQSFVPGRHADVWDWLADAVGAALLLLIVTSVGRWQR